VGHRATDICRRRAPERPSCAPAYRSEHPLTLNSPNFDPPKRETADDLREQAAACRRLAATARTRAGTSSLTALADHFDDQARQIDPLSLRR